MSSRWPDADQLTVALDAWATRAGRFAGGVGRVRTSGAHGEALRRMRVLVAAYVACGDCEVCRRGGASVCPQRVDLPAGAEVTTHVRAVLPLGDDLASPALGGEGGALTASAAAVAYAMYARASIAPRDATIVVGDDVVAHLLVDVLIAKGAPPVVVTTSPALRAHAAARRLHAVAPDALASELPAACLAVEHGTRPRRIFATTLAVPIDAVGLLGPRTAVVTLAPSALAGLDAIALAPWEATCLGVVDGHPDLLIDVAALVQRGELDVAAAAAALDGTTWTVGRAAAR